MNNQVVLELVETVKIPFTNMRDYINVVLDEAEGYAEKALVDNADKKDTIEDCKKEMVRSVEDALTILVEIGKRYPDVAGCLKEKTFCMEPLHSFDGCI